MKKLLITCLLGLVLFGGCSSSDGGSSTPPATNSAPVASVSSLSIAVDEGNTGTLDVASSFSDSDGDTLTYTLVMSDGSALPSGYSITGSVISIVVASDSIVDGANVEHNLSITASDSEANATISIISTLQDIANDSLMTYSTSIPSSVDSNGTLVGSVTLVDSDGLSSTNINFDFQDLGNANVVVYTGQAVDSNDDGVYDFSVDVNAEGVGVGVYRFVSVVSPVVGGEVAQGDVTVAFDFNVSNVAPTWTASSYVTGLTIDDADDGDRVILDLTGVSSDVEGDVISYSVVSISVPAPADQTKWDNSIV